MKAPECLFSVQVISVIPLHEEILEITLNCPEGFTWNAGDYLWVKNSTDEAKPFSIASSPTESHIRLQIAHVDNISEWLTILFNEKSGYISQAIPQFHWTEQTCPIICFAGGTGITPIFSLLLQQLPTTQQSVKLYWGVRKHDLAYLKTELDQLAKEYHHFSYRLVLSAEQNYQEKGILHGFIPELLTQGQLTLPSSPLDVLVCGPWVMVNNIRSALQDCDIHSLQY